MVELFTIALNTLDHMRDKDIMDQEEIFSKVLRAGRRTYFFDVRSTKAGDYYLTITESKKFTHDDGSFHYKKHKIYLYKEDFTAFREIMEEMMDNMNNTYATYEVMLTAGFDNYEISNPTTNLNERNSRRNVGWWFGIGYGTDTTT